MKKYLAVFLTLMAITMVSHGWAQQKQITVKFAWQLPMGNYGSVGNQNLAKCIEEASKGAVKVETYPAGQLYKAAELFPAVRTGTIEMAMFALGTFATVDPVADIVYLPFLVQDKDHMFRILHGKMGKRIEAGSEKAGAKVLAYFAGSGGQYGTKKPVRKPSDFTGLKIRVPGNLPAETIQFLGGTPATIAATEVYLALQQGIVDGTNFPLSSFYDRKLFEVLKYLTLANVSFDPDVVVINSKFWEKLPPETKEIIGNCALRAEKWVFDEESKIAADYKRTLKENGMEIIEIPKENRPQWAEKTKPVVDKFVARLGAEGKDLVESISKESY